MVGTIEAKWEKDTRSPNLAENASVVAVSRHTLTSIRLEFLAVRRSGSSLMLTTAELQGFFHSLYLHDSPNNIVPFSIAAAYKITHSPLLVATMTETIKSMTETMVQTHSASAENILRLFPEINTELATQTKSATQDADLAGYDEEQIRLMDEVCIVLDENDVPIGSASKKVCHLMENINKGLLHRAFSVFLFDSQNRLLLQQRASEKITFPDLWTNTCCSHPLGVPGETGATLDAAIAGVKRAAVRKLDQELGIKAHRVPIEKFDFLTRIHYLAPSDGKWGEHEIDYILFIKADVDVKENPNEVQATKYVTPEELKKDFQDPSLKFTPWFKLICNSMLFEWWENLDTGLDKYNGERELRRML